MGNAGIAASAALRPVAPVFSVGGSYPTADKPQSKLWFALDRWWALLPRAEGPSLWERTADGWREHLEVAATLRGVPGRGDVWRDGTGAVAVTVADRQLAVIQLQPNDSRGQTWTAAVRARLFAPVSDAFETATLARDSAGRWWIAAVVQGKAYVWHANELATWSEPVAVASGLAVDDLCLVTATADGVAVVWSNQRRDAVVIRERQAGWPEDRWSAPMEIAQGGRTADDHLHATLTADGTLWLATKNSVDHESEPQLVLRVRAPDGTWSNRPYAPIVTGHAPTRPVIYAIEGQSAPWLGHVVYHPEDSFQDYAVFGRVQLTSTAVELTALTGFVPAPGLRSRLNDLTGPKHPLPANGPWIVLGSDAVGRVYEYDLAGQP